MSTRPSRQAMQIASMVLERQYDLLGGCLEDFQVLCNAHCCTAAEAALVDCLERLNSERENLWEVSRYLEGAK